MKVVVHKIQIMTFKQYYEKAKPFMKKTKVNVHALTLVTYTANLFEKMSFYKLDSSLMVSSIGSLLFSVFSLMDSMGYNLEWPLDLDALMNQGNDLTSKYNMAEQEIQYSMIMELGIITQIIVNNMQYEIAELNEVDYKRINASLHTYVLYLLILCQKYNLSMQNVLKMNIDKEKLRNNEMNVRSED